MFSVFIEMNLLDNLFSHFPGQGVTTFFSFKSDFFIFPYNNIAHTFKFSHLFF